VVVHYTTKRTEDTAEEIDRIGKDGLRGTVQGDRSWLQDRCLTTAAALRKRTA